MLDYATLRFIWWILLGVLLAGFAIMDGFDLGISMLLLLVARNDEQRRVVLNTVGPVWEGNQIWLVLAGGAIFAAWPALYGVSFSGFYFAMLLILVALILRPVGFKYRSKISNPNWRHFWDMMLFVAGFVPALLFGVALGNVLQGVPFYFDDTLRAFYTGNLIGLLNPFALLCGLVSVVMLMMHGGIFLAIKTNHTIQQRALNYATVGAILFILFFISAGIWIAYGIKGYTVTSQLLFNAPSNPLHKVVTSSVGAWMYNYHIYSYLFLVPVTAIMAVFLALLLLRLKRYRAAWVFSAIAIFAVVATVGASMFPFILPSSSDPAMSLLVWDASSSQTTLFIMLIATIIFMPLIIFYTSWVYYVLRGKVTAEYIADNHKNVY